MTNEELFAVEGIAVVEIKLGQKAGPLHVRGNHLEALVRWVSIDRFSEVADRVVKKFEHLDWLVFRCDCVEIGILISGVHSFSS